MSVIINFGLFVIYFLIGMLITYLISGNNDREYSNPVQGLFAILLWPLILIYKFYKQVKQFFKY
jgi:hypothetical protein